MTSSTPTSPTSSASRTAARPSATWTPSTSSRPSRTLSTASWLSSTCDATAASSSCGPRCSRPRSRSASTVRRWRASRSGPSAPSTSTTTPRSHIWSPSRTPGASPPSSTPSATTSSCATWRRWLKRWGLKPASCQHADSRSQITGVCVALGEYPIIRYYRPRTPTHEASVLCSHLARFVQDKLDMYAQFNQDFPPQSNRPRGALYITDRSMDLYAPFLHELTYQAMALDLLPINDTDKITYSAVVNEDDPGAEEKEMEISDNDKIWVENRHRHMKDTLDKLISDFQKFIADNPNFTNQDAQNAAGMNGLNAIKDMIAGLPQFQQMKESYTLHLGMAEKCMDIFQRHKLPDLASVEQCLATGLDEDYRKAKNMADQVVRTLDDDAVTPADRLRLIALYVLFRDGVLPADLQKLIFHAQLPPPDMEVVRNLDLLGARVGRQLKEKRDPPPPIFPRNAVPPANAEEYGLSRFTPAVQEMLEGHVRGSLPQDIFPFTKAAPEDMNMQDSAQAASLRSAKPTWAKSRLASVEPRQRVLVFMAGGATYSESRACYDISEKTSRDVFLITSHMMKPQLFL